MSVPRRKDYLRPLTSSTVSLAMTSSSFVGTTIIFTLESGVEITASLPRTLFASVSSRQPRYERYSQIAALVESLF